MSRCQVTTPEYETCYTETVTSLVLMQQTWLIYLFIYLIYLFIRLPFPFYLSFSFIPFVSFFCTNLFLIFQKKDNLG
jgi:hypothetical protein